MYTSGTTGDPKGVLISNESIISLLTGVKTLLKNVKEEVCPSNFSFFFFPCIIYTERRWIKTKLIHVYNLVHFFSSVVE